MVSTPLDLTIDFTDRALAPERIPASRLSDFLHDNDVGLLMLCVMIGAFTMQLLFFSFEIPTLYHSILSQTDMDILIRQETAADYEAVFQLIKAAFANEEFSDHKEHYLVQRLRKSEAFVPELSLVAEYKNAVVGHILLTKISIEDEQNQYESLALAPVSVLPDFQRKGVGRQLIEQSHTIAGRLGFTSVVLLGHEDYYPRFGYQPTYRFGIRLPFDAPKENCMVVELTANALQNVRGTVTYDKAFFEG